MSDTEIVLCAGILLVVRFEILQTYLTTRNFTGTHTHTYIYIYMRVCVCVCVCVCVYAELQLKPFRKNKSQY